MDMDIINVVSQVGFPIAVASYSLIVLNKTVSENTKVMIRLSEKMDKCDGKIERGEM